MKVKFTEPDETLGLCKRHWVVSIKAKHVKPLEDCLMDSEATSLLPDRMNLRQEILKAGHFEITDSRSYLRGELRI